MAARRISVQFLNILQRSSTGNRSSTDLETVAVSCQGRLFSSRGLHSDAQAKADNEETHEYESGKMINEGGGNVDGSFAKKSDELKQQQARKGEGVVKDAVSASSHKVDEAKEKVKETTADAEGKAAETKNEAKGQMAKNAETAKDMFKDLPQKVSETATGLKEVGVEAGKAIKRDTEKVAQKVGLKTE